ncbi:MAG: zinc-ribbon domain-containing protein [Anaerolineales bacterium]
MRCPRCAKTIPVEARYCAYCGAPLTPLALWQRLTSHVSIPRPTLIAGAWGMALGALGGVLIGSAFGDVGLGALLGMLGVGLSGAAAEGMLGAIPSRQAAGRFGPILGLLGGAFSMAGGILTGAVVALQGGQPASGFDTVALFVGGLFLGSVCGAAGAIVGVLLGFPAGLIAARIGVRFGRWGAILGGASAWTIGSVVAGALAGDFAGSVMNADRTQSAIAGMWIQLLVGVLLLAQIRRVVRWWQRRWGRTP